MAMNGFILARIDLITSRILLYSKNDKKDL
jgi:hypothetical protein